MREQDLLKKLGLQIRAFRRSAGLTLEELAERVGVTYRTISDIERGLQFTSLGHLYTISKAVNRDLQDLFAWARGKKNEEETLAARSPDRIADDNSTSRKNSKIGQT